MDIKKWLIIDNNARIIGSHDAKVAAEDMVATFALSGGKTYMIAEIHSKVSHKIVVSVEKM
jgi:hypothetical protein